MMLFTFMTLMVMSCTKEVTGVSLDASEMTLEVGQEYRLTAFVEPEKAANPAVTWNATPEGIVTVGEDGLVKGIAPGKAVVKATTVDGGFSAECQVTVAGLSADKSELVMQVGDNATVNVTSAGDYSVKCTPENLVLTTKNSDGSLTISTTDATGEGTITISAADSEHKTDIKVTVLSKLAIHKTTSYSTFTMFFAGGYIEYGANREVEWTITPVAEGLTAASESKISKVVESANRCEFNLGRYVDSSSKNKNFKVVISAVDKYGFKVSEELEVKGWTPVLYLYSSGKYVKVDPATFDYSTGNTLAISLHDSNDQQCPFIEWMFVSFSENVWTLLDCPGGYYQFDLSENISRNDNYATMKVMSGITNPNITVKIGEYSQVIDFKGNVAIH